MSWFQEPFARRPAADGSNGGLGSSIVFRGDDVRR